MPFAPAPIPEVSTLNETERVDVEPTATEDSFAPIEQASGVREKPRLVSREEILVELLHAL